VQRLFWTILFQSLGWNTKVQFPAGIKKCVIIAGPHTHWMDFPVGLAYRSLLRLKNARFLGRYFKQRGRDHDCAFSRRDS